MAFNFNWKPLAADAEFYGRAKDLLTRALNKSPKPPIIVDDILVSDFNIGSVPPDLSILEIGDLADDRFRGIFKMCYSGDAFITLKTRVQANPMNTYVNSTPSFASPQPLAAADGLTIPLSITLSEFRLSAFIIVVYLKHKGVTIVFRNDPLESLKVSSTFDSIAFVRQYLQTTIEKQLRTLIMDELPAIIHRLSLQILCKRTVRDDEDGEGVINPLASPPTDPVDAYGNVLDAEQISFLELEDSGEPNFHFHSLFSHLNLLRLKRVTISPSHCAGFSPGLREMIFRGVESDFSESSGSSTPQTPTPGLVKSESYMSVTSNTYSFSDTGSSSHGFLPARPSLVSLGSATQGLALGSGRARSYQGRKRKHRVINLRKSKSAATSDTSSEAGESSSDAVSVSDAMSEPIIHSSIPEEPEEQGQVPPTVRSVRIETEPEKARVPSRPALPTDLFQEQEAAPERSTKSTSKPVRESVPTSSKAPASHRYSEKAPERYASTTPASMADAPGVILEQAWISKMASEIARRVYDEKNRQEGFWDEREEMPPPAYEATR